MKFQNWDNKNTFLSKWLGMSRIIEGSSFFLLYLCEVCNVRFLAQLSPCGKKDEVVLMIFGYSLCGISVYTLIDDYFLDT